MTTPSSTASLGRYEFRVQPQALVSSFALESSAPHIASALLILNILGVADTGLQLGPAGSSRQEDAAAQFVERLWAQALGALLDWEAQQSPKSRECCLPLVDVALDALAQASLEILIPGFGTSLPSAARIHATCREATAGGDDRAVVGSYYRHYVRRLALFALTELADIHVGPGRPFSNLRHRNLFFLSKLGSCDAGIRRLDIPAPSTDRSTLEEAVARSRGVADMIGSMSFVGRLPYPQGARRIILCGTENSDHAAMKDSGTIFLSGDPPDNSVAFRCERIEKEIGASISSISRDLVEVATYVFAGDSLVHRTARWRRAMHFIIPVRNLERWTSLSPDLSMLLSFVAGDHISVEFVPRQAEEERKVDGEPVPGDCVCLLSGGLDSFAGALQLLQNRRRPVLLGHFKQGHVASRQREVAGALNRLATGELALGKLAALRLDSGLTPKRKQHGFRGKLEYTQRTRSFLFLSLALAVADGLGLQEIFIPENGVVALNVPLAACRTGSRSTRSAHPRFLWSFQELVRRLYGREFKIRNPLIFRTKAEVLETFRGSGVEEVLGQSISCSRYWYGVMMDGRRGGRDCTHCGTCLACLIRRAAMVEAGLARHDADYIMQPFEEFDSLKEGERLGLLHLVDFCTAISNASDEAILLRHPQLMLPNRYFSDVAKGSIAALEAAGLYRRFANEVLRMVQEAAGSRGETEPPLLRIAGLTP